MMDARLSGNHSLVVIFRICPARAARADNFATILLEILAQIGVNHRLKRKRLVQKLILTEAELVKAEELSVD